MCKTFGPRSQNMETHYKTSNGHQRALDPWFLKKKKTKTWKHCLELEACKCGKGRSATKSHGNVREFYTAQAVVTLDLLAAFWITLLTDTQFAYSVLTLLVGWQEGHPACKKLSGGVWAWLSVWGKVQICIFAYVPADTTAAHCLLLQEIQIGLVLPFRYRLTQVKWL